MEQIVAELMLIAVLVAAYGWVCWKWGHRPACYGDQDPNAALCVKCIYREECANASDG